MAFTDDDFKAYQLKAGLGEQQTQASAKWAAAQEEAWALEIDIMRMLRQGKLPDSLVFAAFGPGIDPNTILIPVESDIEKLKQTLCIRADPQWVELTGSVICW